MSVLKVEVEQMLVILEELGKKYPGDDSFISDEFLDWCTSTYDIDLLDLYGLK